MKSAVTRTWRSLISKLHPPLTMTSRGSQQLLSLLNASFKQQLDREYPSHSSSNKQQANRHLQSILTDPLFDTKHCTRAKTSSQSQSMGECWRQKQNYMKEPMVFFKERVSQGKANLEIAKFCLRTQYKACLASPAAKPREAMQSSRAASTILQWLWSSGMEDAGTFLNDLDFVALLLPFLIAEGHQSRILRWLQRCRWPEKSAFSSLRELEIYRIQRFLFRNLIRQEISIGNGLESAINVYLQTFAGLQNFGSSMQQGALSAAWTLTKAIIDLPKAAEPKPSIVHAFLKTTRDLKPDLLHNAILCVYIERQPDPQPALILFQNISAKRTRSFSAGRRPHMALLGLKAAELLLQDGRQSEAHWMMKFLQENFSQEIGSQLPEVRKRSSLFSNKSRSLLESEKRSLLLLDKLTVQ